MINKSIYGLLLLCLLPFLALAQKTVPEPTNFLVNDFAGMFSRQEVVLLGQKLRAYANETSTQIVVVTENSLEGENVFDYAHRLATTWGIGGRENDNGILLFVAKEERKISIQTGYGAEGFLPDATAFTIIQNTIIPAFREGKFYEGIDRAVSAIMELGRGEYTNDGSGAKRDANGAGAGFFIFVAILVIVLLLVLFGKKGSGDDDEGGGYYRGGRYDDPNNRRSRGFGRGGGGGWIFFPGGGFGGGFGGGGNRGSDGGGFGGFGGGDFGGFGGGDFGGGGAIGEW